jgi:hypothetical protein
LIAILLVALIGEGGKGGSGWFNVVQCGLGAHCRSPLQASGSELKKTTLNYFEQPSTTFSPSL